MNRRAFTDRLREVVADRWSSHTLQHGHHLIGAGTTRWGWAVYTVAGDGIYLGRTAQLALREIKEHF